MTIHAIFASKFFVPQIICLEIALTLESNIKVTVTKGIIIVLESIGDS